MELRASPVERLLPMLAGELNSFFFANVGLVKKVNGDLIRTLPMFEERRATLVAI